MISSVHVLQTGGLGLILQEFLIDFSELCIRNSVIFVLDRNEKDYGSC